MTARRFATLALLLALAFPGAAAAATGGTPATGGLAGTIGYGSFSSTAIAGASHYSVYLPPGYASSGLRYPVVYLLHGLPAGSTAYRGIDFAARAVEQSGHRAIVVGAQGARTSEPDSEWLDWGPRHNWETATARELVSVIDSRYRTIPSRAGRAIIGYSAGGYGAALIGFHNPRTFSVIQSWCGYFQPTNPSGSAVISLGSRAADNHASLYALIPQLRALLGHNYGRTYFGVFSGMRDGRFYGDNVRLMRELRAQRVPNVNTARYSGGHSVWHAHATAWIDLALKQAAQPR